MKFFFIIIFIIGLFLVRYAYNWFLEMKSKKVLFNFNLGEVNKIIDVENGIYSLSFLGDGFVMPTNTFKVLIEFLNGNERVEVSKNLLNYRFKKGNKKGIEYLRFEINKPGGYELKIINPDSLIMKKSMLKSKRLIQKKMNIEDIRVLIKEFTPVKKRVLSIIFLIFGVNCILWGLIGGIFW